MRGPIAIRESFHVDVVAVILVMNTRRPLKRRTQWWDDVSIDCQQLLYKLTWNIDYLWYSVGQINKERISQTIIIQLFWMIHPRGYFAWEVAARSRKHIASHSLEFDTKVYFIPSQVTHEVSAVILFARNETHRSGLAEGVGFDHDRGDEGRRHYDHSWHWYYTKWRPRRSHVQRVAQEDRTTEWSDNRWYRVNQLHSTDLLSGEVTWKPDFRE